MRPAYIRRTGAAAAAHSRAAWTVRSAKGRARGARGHSHFLGWVGGRQVGRAGNCGARRSARSPLSAVTRVGIVRGTALKDVISSEESGGVSDECSEWCEPCRVALSCASGTRC